MFIQRTYWLLVGFVILGCLFYLQAYLRPSENSFAGAEGRITTCMPSSAEQFADPGQHLPAVSERLGTLQKQVAELVRDRGKEPRQREEEAETSAAKLAFAPREEAVEQGRSDSQTLQQGRDAPTPALGPMPARTCESPCRAGGNLTQACAPQRLNIDWCAARRPTCEHAPRPTCAAAPEPPSEEGSSWKQPVLFAAALCNVAVWVFLGLQAARAAFDDDSWPFLLNL